MTTAQAVVHFPLYGYFPGLNGIKGAAKILNCKKIVTKTLISGGWGGGIMTMRQEATNTKISYKIIAIFKVAS